MDGNELAAQFIADTRWDDLPEAVQHKVKMCLVDIVAAIVGGVLTPISDIAAAYAPVAWQGDEATIPSATRQACDGSWRCCGTLRRYRTLVSLLLYFYDADQKRILSEATRQCV